MNRRTFLRGTTLLLLAPRMAEGQVRTPRVGVLTPGVPASPITRANNEAFELALRELGWRSGENIRLDYRYGDGDAARVTQMVSEVVELGVDVIVARSSAVA